MINYKNLNPLLACILAIVVTAFICTSAEAARTSSSGSEIGKDTSISTSATSATATAADTQQKDGSATGCKYDGKNCFTDFINNGFKLKY